MSVGCSIIKVMKIKIEFNRKLSRRKSLEKSEIVFRIVENIRQEIEKNPELLETKYMSENEVAEEVLERLEDIECMERMAETLKGGWRGELKYKFSNF